MSNVLVVDEALKDILKVMKTENNYEKLPPAQKQYMDLRQAYPDCILFFRMGDFYETFYDDAKIASKVLDLTLTARDKQ
jgi:DNA mismatch repair protein MutS